MKRGGDTATVDAHSALHDRTVVEWGQWADLLHTMAAEGSLYEQCHIEAITNQVSTTHVLCTLHTTHIDCTR